MDANLLTLNERAYDYAYKASNDWLIETPTWEHVQEAYACGVKETLEAVGVLVKKYGIKPSDFEEIKKRILE